MKFNDLYKRVIISEQDTNTEVADPNDVEVKPIPVPEPAVNKIGRAHV